MEVLLLGCLALIPSWISSCARVHQTDVAVVFMRFNSTNVDLATGGIVTCLQDRRIVECQIPTVCVQGLSVRT